MYSIFRDSDNRELGTVGEGYTVKQNSECFQFIDTLLEANGGSHYDTAGALGNGSKIFCSVRVPKADISIGDDKQEVSLIFTTSHDGSMSHTAAISATRPVCQNTLKAALADATAMFRVRHTKNGDARLNRAKELMGSVTVNAKALEEKLNLLARRKMTRKSMVTILNVLFPVPKEENASTTRRENVISEVLTMYADNDNNTFPEQRGTAYNMLNAITQFTDHARTVRMTKDRDGMSVVQARAENAAVGSGDALKASALAVIERETVNTPDNADAFVSPMDDVTFMQSIGIKF
jgi:phage/plasmid-like protein (TIGR03299 family)